MKVKLTYTQTGLRKIDLTSPYDLKRLEFKSYSPIQSRPKILGHCKGWVHKLNMLHYPNPNIGEYIWVRGKAKKNKLNLSTWTYAMCKVLEVRFKSERVRVMLLFNREGKLVHKKSLFLERG